MSTPERSDRTRDAVHTVDRYYRKRADLGTSSRALFNKFASHYNLINLVFSLGSGSWYRRRCLRRSGGKSGMTVIDIAVGTGLLAREIKRIIEPDGSLVGIDLSEAMLRKAQKSLRIPLIQGSAEQLPIASASADIVTLGYALRHLDNMHLALDEARRVLKPGGKLILIEMSVPATGMLRAFHTIAIGKILPFISYLLTRDKRARRLMSYHWETISTYPSPETLVSYIASHSFRDVRHETEFRIFHLFTAQKPEKD